ncbi:MAG: shikimate kinase [Bacteroidales bacterium]|jgi:shikimate kinase|nr:shikimate kinase [Bacteroidales bacterium]
MKIFVVGYMASGKTRFARRLANALGKPFIDLDQVIFDRTQRTPGEWIREYGEEKFRQTELLCLLHCLEQDNFVMATGGGTPCFFDNMNRLNKEGVTIWLKTPIGKIIQRLRNRKGDRPLVATREGNIDREALQQHYSDRVPFYSKAKIEVVDVDISLVIDQIRKLQS